jgi:20S proteasome alpha/beta subunit
MIEALPKPPAIFTQKPQRLPKGKRMTIAACLKCRGGVVFGADTDETVGDVMRRRVYKIPNFEDGSCTAFITGACMNGHLMDAAVERIFDRLKEVKPPDNQAAHKLLREVMLKLYRTDFQSFPAKETRMQLLVGIRPHEEARVETWSISSAVVRRMHDSEIVGYGELAQFVLDHLYVSGIPLDNGIVIMIQLLAVAKKRVNYVGGDSCVAVQKDSGGWAVENVGFSPEQDELYESFISFGRQLMLATALSQTTDEQYDGLIAGFAKQLKWLRQKLCQSSSARFRESLFVESSRP